MNIIVIHHESGDTVAVVSDLDNLKGVASYSLIDEDDSKDIIKRNPRLQKEIQNIFSAVMHLFGFSISKPKGESNEP